MSLAWHERLVERLIKNSNGDATIKDYFNIVDQNDKSDKAMETLVQAEKLYGVKWIDNSHTVDKKNPKSSTYKCETLKVSESFLHNSYNEIGSRNVKTINSRK